MLPLSWQRLLMLSLWILPHVLLGVLAVVVYRRRLYRAFPCFLAYALYEVGEFVLMFTLYWMPGLTGTSYAYAYYATLTFSVVLRFGVIDEVSKDLFRDSKFLKASARRSLQRVTGLLMAVSVLLAIYAPGDNNVRWIAGVSVVNRGAALVQCGLLLSLLLLSRFLGLTWRRPAFGITLGLGVLTSADLAVYALRAQLTSSTWVPYLDLLRTGTYLACVLIWIGYSLASERKPASLAVLPRDEVETWNTAFQHLLRD